MERAGSEDMDLEVERKGLGTPATRADIIEKLIGNGYMKREKKNLVPTVDGSKLITVVPEVVKSAKLTADWENALALVAKGELASEDFMDGIVEMVKDLIQTYRGIEEEEKGTFFKEKTPLGECPNCGGKVLVGKYGPYCEGKCGMGFSKFKVKEKGTDKEYILGVNLTRPQLESLLEGKRTYVEKIPKKKGGTYAAYLTPEKVIDYSYLKDGEEIRGKQYFVELEYAKKKGGFRTNGKNK